MKIIALEEESEEAQPSAFIPHLKPEAKKLWELYQCGHVREVYFREDQKLAVLILECESVESAKQILSRLPLVKKGLIRFELIPLIPYSGFERLFVS